MAELDEFANWPAPEPRKRRLLSLYEMTGNPFVTGSPYVAPLRRGPAGASGSWEEPEPPRFAPPSAEAPPLAPQQAVSAQLRGQPAPQPTRRAAADTSLTSIPTQGAQAAPAAGTDRRQPVYDEIKKLDEYLKTPDMTQAVNAYRQRYEAAGPDMASAFMLGMRGGEFGRQFGGQVLKNALARRQPEKTDYGTLDASGFTSDPMKEREFNISRTEKKIAMLELIATHANTEEEKKLAREALVESKREALQLRRDMLGQAAQGKFAHYTDPESGQTVFYNTRTLERVASPGGGAPGGGAPGAPGGAPGEFPAKPSPKATEDERRIASNVQRIVSSAGLMTPEGASPGAMEAAASQVPYVGEGAASAVRGASGTMGVGQKSRQATYQSQADIIDSLLYISTGAAYNKEQLATMREAYMPAWTDNAQAKAGKIQRLKGMVQAAKARAGRAWTQDAEDALQAALPGLTGNAAPAAGSRPTNFPKANAPKGNPAQRADSFLEQAGGD